MKAQAPINSNIEFWQNILQDRHFKERAREYAAKQHSLFRYPRVTRKWDSYLCSFHSHSDGNTLRGIAERASNIGYRLFAITDHLADYKKFEDRFGEREIEYFDDFGVGRGVFLMRGVECHCVDEGTEIKLLILGYRNPKQGEKPIEPGKSLAETLERAKSLDGIVITTSTLNQDSKGIDAERLHKHKDDFDAYGTLDSAYGLFLPFWFSRLYVSDIASAIVAERDKKAGIYELNSHFLDAIGSVGTYIPKENLACLANPEAVKENPRILTSQLRAALRAGPESVQNEGGYCSMLGPFRNTDMSKIVLEDIKDANFRHIRNFFRFLKKPFIRN